MLKSVLGDFLDKVRERELDAPLLSLLSAMGFYDVHLVHGHVEFGKDFIAKKRVGKKEIQYSLQSKVGDITNAAWRNDIQGQLLESLLNPIAHPNFDTRLPHQAILATTGLLRGNARVSFQQFNLKVKNKFKERPVEFWDKQNLVEYFMDYGLEALHSTSPKEVRDYARFFLVYSKALQGHLSDRDIEEYSRSWLDNRDSFDRHLLRCVVESEVLAQQCLMNGQVYEAIIVHLARQRIFYGALYEGESSPISALLHAEGLERIRELCAGFISNLLPRWEEKRDLISLVDGGVLFTTYPVLCARILDIAALTYFISTENSTRASIANFVASFVEVEQGASHPISDRYAVSLVLATLVLCDQGHTARTRTLLQQATVWLCDRYETGAGLAGFGEDETAEISALLGYVFEFLSTANLKSSFLATALGDLAAFLGEQSLYEDIVNDIKASDIHAEYWQPKDSAGVCAIEGDDIVSYPAIQFEDVLTHFLDYFYATHMPDEEGAFRFVDTYGLAAAIVLIVLMRDRYFPKLWSRLAPSHQALQFEATEVA